MLLLLPQRFPYLTERLSWTVGARPAGSIPLDSGEQEEPGAERRLLIRLVSELVSAPGWSRGVDREAMARCSSATQSQPAFRPHELPEASPEAEVRRSGSINQRARERFPY
jgi:hypothetical protein